MAQARVFLPSSSAQKWSSSSSSLPPSKFLPRLEHTSQQRARAPPAGHRGWSWAPSSSSAVTVTAADGHKGLSWASCASGMRRVAASQPLQHLGRGLFFVVVAAPPPSQRRRGLAQLLSGGGPAAIAPEAPPGFVVHTGFITQEEHDDLVAGVQGSLFRRRRYERDHWDSVIVNYRETEAHDAVFGPSGRAALSRWRDRLRADYSAVEAFLPTHCIDLADDGHITPHVDSIKFSGGLVAGLSLLAPSTVCLQRATPDGDPDPGAPVFRCHLQPRSMYVLAGEARYEYTHSIVDVTRRRLSLILRDVKETNS